METLATVGNIFCALVLTNKKNRFAFKCCVRKGMVSCGVRTCISRKSVDSKLNAIHRTNFFV